MRHAGTALLAGAVALALTACSSSGDGGETSKAPVSTPAPVATSTSAAPSETPTPTPTKTKTPTPSTTAPSTTAASTTSAAPVTTTAGTVPPAFTTTCPKLTVMVIPGGAMRGAEIAALQYVNDGPSACTITGVPSAHLLRNGQKIGTPSAPNGARVLPFTLQPGDVGESLLRDFSTCNAPLSDSIRITTPVRNGGSARTVVRPAKLRACLLRIAPVGRPA